MPNYNDINPYELMYRNMNICIHQNMTKEHAEIVARQLGYMHNAFGAVVKDFIKILSYKFRGRERERGKDREREQPSYEQMEAEEHIQPSFQKKHDKPTEKAAEKEIKEKKGRDRTFTQIVLESQKKNNEPSNKMRTQTLFDEEQAAKNSFLQEFAFDNKEVEQLPKKITEIPSLKVSLTKIVEEVANKKRIGNLIIKDSVKDSVDASLQLKSPSLEPSPAGQPLLQNRDETVSQQKESPFRAQGSPEENTLSIFGQFTFAKEEKVAPNIPKPSQSAIGNTDSETQGRQMMRQLRGIRSRKGTPTIYEISDDEN